MADILDKDLVGIVGSIFATSPEAMKIARERADLTRAQAIANAEAQQMGGGSALNANIMGGQAVRQLGGLLGVQDPMMQRESAKRQLATGLDMSKPEQVMEYAQRLADAGLQQESAQAIVGARAMQQQLANLGKTRAEEQAKLREKVPPVQEQADTIRFNELVKQFGEVEGARKYREEQLAGKQSVAKAGATPGDRNVLDIDKEDAKTLVKVRTAAEKSIPLLEGQLKSVKQGMIQGTFSDARAVFANSMASLGIKNKEILNLLASTDTFRANRIGLASAVAKELGVNPTDRDFQASLDRFASGSMQPEVAETFIKDLLALSKQNLKNANDGLNYYRTNQGSFAGYDRPLPTIPGTTDPLQSMSLQELKALEQQLLNGKK